MPRVPQIARPLSSALVVIVAATLIPFASAAQRPPAGATDTLHELVIREMFSLGISTAENRNPAVLCIGLDAPSRVTDDPDLHSGIGTPDLDLLRDPSPDLLKRLREADKRVRSSNACTRSRWVVTARAEANHVRGLILWSRAVEFASDSSATARGGYYEGVASSAEWLCRFRRVGLTWVLSYCDMEWIS